MVKTDSRKVQQRRRFQKQRLANRLRMQEIKAEIKVAPATS